MKNRRDNLTRDMFAELPPAPVTAAGGLSCRSEIAHAMSEAMKGYDRYEIAAKMSRLLDRDISKHMLDAYTAESREDHIPPLDTAIAFDLATESRVLAELFARKIGARLAVGMELPPLNGHIMFCLKEKKYDTKLQTCLPTGVSSADGGIGSIRQMPEAIIQGIWLPLHFDTNLVSSSRCTN